MMGKILDERRRTQGDAADVAEGQPGALDAWLAGVTTFDGGTPGPSRPPQVA